MDARGGDWGAVRGGGASVLVSVHVVAGAQIPEESNYPLGGTSFDERRCTQMEEVA